MSPLGSYVVQTSVTLVAVLAVAFIAVYGARRAGLGRPPGPLTLTGKLPLDARRAVYVVRLYETEYVIASTETGVVKLGEIPVPPSRTTAPEASG